MLQNLINSSGKMLRRICVCSEALSHTFCNLIGASKQTTSGLEVIQRRFLNSNQVRLRDTLHLLACGLA